MASTCESSDYDFQKEIVERLDLVVNRIKNDLLVRYKPDSSLIFLPVSHRTKDKTIMSSIEYVFLSIFRNPPPKLSIRTQSWNNSVYNESLNMKSTEMVSMREIKFCEIRSIKKFSLNMFIIGKIYSLLASDKYCNKRQLYYNNTDKFSSQDMLDSILNDITCLLNVSLYDLHIYTTSRGLIYGPIEIVTPRANINCQNSRGGTLIPNDISMVRSIISRAKFVLLIEKDTVFQKIIEDTTSEIFEDCIFITGKGFPDMNTRLLLKCMWNTLSLPIFALVDPNPYGIDIMCVYRFGSLNMMHLSDSLAVPSICWLGIFPSEIERFCDAKKPLTTKDQSLLTNMLERPYVKKNPKIEKELKLILEKAWKAEIENVGSTPSYLTSVYIPQKLLTYDFK